MTGRETDLDAVERQMVVGDAELAQQRVRQTQHREEEEERHEQQEAAHTDKHAQGGADARHQAELLPRHRCQVELVAERAQSDDLGLVRRLIVPVDSVNNRTKAVVTTMSYTLFLRFINSSSTME